MKEEARWNIGRVSRRNRLGYGFRIFVIAVAAIYKNRDSPAALR